IKETDGEPGGAGGGVCRSIIGGGIGPGAPGIPFRDIAAAHVAQLDQAAGGYLLVLCRVSGGGRVIPTPMLMCCAIHQSKDHSPVRVEIYVRDNRLDFGHLVLGADDDEIESVSPRRPFGAVTPGAADAVVFAGPVVVELNVVSRRGRIQIDIGE